MAKEEAAGGKRPAGLEFVSLGSWLEMLRSATQMLSQVELEREGDIFGYGSI